MFIHTHMAIRRNAAPGYIKPKTQSYGWFYGSRFACTTCIALLIYIVAGSGTNAISTKKMSVINRLRIVDYVCLRMACVLSVISELILMLIWIARRTIKKFPRYIDAFRSSPRRTFRLAFAIATTISSVSFFRLA